MADTEEDGKRRKVDPEEAINAMAERGRYNSGKHEKSAGGQKISIDDTETFSKVLIDNRAYLSRQASDDTERTKYIEKRLNWWK